MGKNNFKFFGKDTKKAIDSKITDEVYAESVRKYQRDRDAIFSRIPEGPLREEARAKLMWAI